MRDGGITGGGILNVGQWEGTLREGRLPGRPGQESRNKGMFKNPWHPDNRTETYPELRQDTYSKKTGSEGGVGGWGGGGGEGGWGGWMHPQMSCTCMDGGDRRV